MLVAALAPIREVDPEREKDDLPNHGSHQPTPDPAILVASLCELQSCAGERATNQPEPAAEHAAKDERLRGALLARHDWRVRWSGGSRFGVR